jgi:geranylgeranyl diphosphate synthase type II
MSGTGTEHPSIHIWLDTARHDVDAALGRYLPAEPACPARVGEAMRYSLFAGGKRLRPVLAVAAAEAAAQALRDDPAHARALALPAACAIELIHTYSLVHDDLPAMDDDTLRRGRPTNHVVFGEGLAILAGDALLTEAFALLAREPDAQLLGDDGLVARKLRAIRTIAEAAGPCGMVGGQAIDLDAAAPGARLDADALRSMHARKTGALIRAAALAGAIMASADEAMLDAIGRYASELGLAFQIVDDILDVEGASVELGKTAGKDAAAGKPTYPALYGLEASRRLAAECVDRALHALASASLQGQLPAIARWVVDRSH